MPAPLISVDELRALLAGGSAVRLLDVRWRLDRPEGRIDYVDGHLPGAVYVDLEHELSERLDPRHGRHPLPELGTLQAAARRWGLRTGDTVVVYDDLLSVGAARAWWLLSRAGIADVRVLDGGLRAWVAARGPVETGDVRAAPGDVVLAAPEGHIDIDQAEHWPSRGVLIDARAPGRYRGGDDPNDPVGGHVPGAFNLPTTMHLDAGRFRTPDEIRILFARAGVHDGTPVAAYCGSGVAAAHTVLAGAIAGIDVALYAGSWSQWSRTRGRLAAVGPTPAREIRYI